MPGEATETVPVTEQEMQQPQVETGSYVIASHERACNNAYLQRGPGTQRLGGIVQQMTVYGRLIC